MFDENNTILLIMATNMHSTAKILLFSSLPLILAIFIDFYFKSLRMGGDRLDTFCRPKKNTKILELNAKIDGFRRMQLCHQFSWLLPWTQIIMSGHKKSRVIFKNLNNN